MLRRHTVHALREGSIEVFIVVISVRSSQKINVNNIYICIIKKTYLQDQSIQNDNVIWKASPEGSETDSGIVDSFADACDHP